MRFGGGDDGVEARDAEGSGVEGCGAVLPELVVGAVFLWGGYVVEAPGRNRNKG